MAYTKTTWINGVVEKPRTYNKTDNPDGTITLSPAFGTVIQEGTPVNAANMNNIEIGLEELQLAKVEKEVGKGLSSNDFTNTHKEKVEKTNLTKGSLTIPATGWGEATNHGEYIKKVEIPLVGVTTSDFISVVPLPEHTEIISDCELSTLVDEGDGKLTFYAKEIPANEIVCNYTKVVI